MNSSLCKEFFSRTPLSQECIETVAIAEEASAIVMGYFNTALTVDYKVDRSDPVTEADRAVDIFIRNRIQSMFSDDKLLSEEHPETPDNNADRIWMIDPIGGTNEFIRGRHNFSINIGLLIDGAPAMGVVAVPAQGRYYAAERNIGAFACCGGIITRLKTSNVENMKFAQLLTRFSDGTTRELDTTIAELDFSNRIPMGSLGTKLCMIAEGRADAHIATHPRVAKWDSLAADVILAESGGSTTDLNGIPLQYAQQNSLWGKTFVSANNSVLRTAIINALLTRNFS